MTRFILLTVFTSLIMSFAYVFDSITPQNVLQLFPICETSSSLGQKCKYSSRDRKPNNFLNVCCDGSENITFLGNTISIDRPNEWNYSFTVRNKLFFINEIDFTDKAMNGGSYHTKTKYFAVLVGGKIFLSESSSEQL